MSKRRRRARQRQDGEYIESEIMQGQGIDYPGDSRVREHMRRRDSERLPRWGEITAVDGDLEAVARVL